jgi:lipopolysaccharide/colanic/teichoic acid biosynthesis glycosyltransferase
MSEITDTPKRSIPSRLPPESPPAGLGVGAARRVVDLAVSAVALVLVAPLMLLVCLLVLVIDGRPVFFRQRRVGEGGEVFMLYKFRTMRLVQGGPAVTARADARITRLGLILRRTSFDELPQLWHVLRGQMTLVGPRPESEELAARYPEWCRIVLMTRPGLTGPAQLSYRERSAVPPPGWTDVEQWYLTVLVPLRAAADLEYLRRPRLGQTFRYLGITALFCVGLIDIGKTVDPPLVPRQRSPQTGPSTTASGSTTIGSQRALTHSPDERSNSKL